MKNKIDQAAYDIIITGPVRQDLRLSDSQRLLYGELRGLCRKEGFCWASNTYLAKLRGKQVRAVQNDLRKLEACGHIQVEYDPENKNLRKIFMTDGMQKNAYPMQKKTSLKRGMQKNAQGMKKIARGMQKNDAGGMQKNAQVSGGIRKNINITTTSTGKKGDDDVELKHIPEKIKSRFAINSTLMEFINNCGNNTAIMGRYLDYADKQPVKNPVGLAVRMAQQQGANGPPDAWKEKWCAFCDDKGEKCFMHQGVKVWMCYDHRRQYQKLIESGQTAKAAAVLDKALIKLRGPS